MTADRPRLRPAILLALLAPALVACISSPPAGTAARACAARPGGPDDGLYYLPFPAGASHLCVQEGPGPLSHSGSQTYAIDFAMSTGSPVVAARAGVVSAVKDDSDQGGASKKYAKLGNYVRVRHADGTEGVYLHLQKGGSLVTVGQRVERGQQIARSGCTGWSALPHLHFQLDRRDACTGRWTSVPVRFTDVRGDGVPDFLWTYVSGNQPPPVR